MMNKAHAEWLNNPRWLDNDVQFPRLLAEINAVGLSPTQYQQLSESMNLSPRDIDELLARAEAEWEAIKS